MQRQNPNQNIQNEKETDVFDRQAELEERAPQSKDSLDKISNPSPHSGSLAAEKNGWNRDDQKGILLGEHKDAIKH